MNTPVQTSQGGEVLPARRLSTQTVKAQRAHEVHTQIVKGMRAIKRQWIDLAGLLYEFGVKEMWRDLGYESQEAWLADPEVDIERRKFFEHTGAWQQLVIDKGVRPEDLRTLHVSKVAVVVPAIRRGQVTVEEAFSDCETLSKSDLSLKYSGQASKTPGKPDTSTRIHAELEPMYRKCDSCGGSGRVKVPREDAAA